MAPRFLCLLVPLVSLTAALIAMTGVIRLGVGESLPLGARPATTVPLFNLWTYQHTAEYLNGDAEAYWSPAVFAPREGMLAMSDPQPITASVFAILRWAFSPVVAYNVLVLLVLMLNGVAAGWLAWTLRCGWPAIAVTSILAGWMPFVASEIGVLQMAVLSPVIWTLGLLTRFHHIACSRDAAMVGVGIAACYLTSGYWGLWLAFACAAGAFALVRPEHFRLASIAGIVTAVAIVLVGCGPFVFYQQKYVGEYHWDGDYIDSLAAGVVDYVRVGDESVAAKMPWTIFAGAWPIRLYPGGLLLLASARGTWVLLKATRQEESLLQRRWLFFVLVMIQFALVLSFGRIELLGDASPMNLLQDCVPGLEKLRSPYRLGMFVSVLMLPLAAVGVDRMMSAKSPRWRYAGTAIVLLGVAEVCPWTGFVAGETDIAATLTRAPAWCRFLKDQSDSTHQTDRLLYLPMGDSEASYAATCRAMLLQPTHGIPMIGGYSGFFPPQVKQLESLSREFPDGPSAMAILRAGATIVVVDQRRMTDRAAANLDRLPKLLQREFTDQEAGIFIYRFTDEAIESMRERRQ